MSDARSQRLDAFRQGREKQEVLLQLHNQQVKAEAEAEAQAAAAAAAGSGAADAGDDTEDKRAPRVQPEEDRNLVVIIKADVQVHATLLHLLSALHLVQQHTAGATPQCMCGYCGACRYYDVCKHASCMCPATSCNESCK